MLNKRSLALAIGLASVALSCSAVEIDSGLMPDDYDIAGWDRYYKEHPVKFRSVSAEGDDDDDDKDKDKELQAKIDAAVAAATQGLKEKNQELIDKNKNLSSFAKKYEGVDVEGLTALQKKIQEDEILSLLADGKTQEALDKQTERLRAQHQSELERIQKERDELKGSYESANQTVTKLVLDSAVSREFAAAKGLDTASDDAMWRAQQVFKVEDGEPIARDKNGEIIRGENGPLTIKEWVASLKESAPHLFPGSAGVDLPGGSGGDEKSDEARLIAASKKGPAALRAEKERQAKARAAKQQ